MISLTDIQQLFRGTIAMDEPMSRHTWMRVGGTADFYVEPADREDLLALVSYFQSKQYPWFILGRGSNVLVSDEGIRGAVINVEPALSGVRVEGDLVVAEAGLRLTKFVDACIQHQCAGVEMLAGIPGTLGGALAMNAGAHGVEIADHVVDIEVLRDGRVVKVKKEEAGFAYRSSGFTSDIVLQASFRFPAGEMERLAALRREYILRRNQTQPLDLPNLGSMFKNPSTTHAAKLIEQSGLKGKRVGGAQVSEKHANFIVNLGNATAAHVMTLIELIKHTVYQHSGVMLELEVKLVGFSSPAKESI